MCQCHGQPVGRAAVDFQRVVGLQRQVKADERARFQVHDLRVHHRRGGAAQRGCEGHRKAAVVAQHCHGAVLPDAVLVTVVADGERKRWPEAAQHAADGGQVVPVGLRGVQHEAAARVRGVAGEIGCFLQHKPREVPVAEVEGAFCEVRQAAGEKVRVFQLVRTPECYIQRAGHAGDALPLHGRAGLVDALSRLQVYVGAIERVEEVGHVVVPAQMQDGTGVGDDL